MPATEALTRGVAAVIGYGRRTLPVPHRPGKVTILWADAPPEAAAGARHHTGDATACLDRQSGPALSEKADPR